MPSNKKLTISKKSGSDVKTRQTKITIENYDLTKGYSFSKFLEDELLKKKTFQLQSSGFLMEQGTEVYRTLDFVKNHIKNILADNAEDMDWWSDKLESLMLAYAWSLKCNTFGDYVLLMQTTYKLMTGRSAGVAICEMMTKMFGQVQAHDMESMLKDMRKAFDAVESVGENPLIKKMTSLYSHLLVQGFLARFGLEITNEEYSGMERRAMNAAYSSKKNLWMNIIDVALFVCERLYEWRKTGDISQVYHTSGAYVKWLAEADRILTLAPFTSNLEAHGTTYFTFVSDLAAAVEQGEAYAKFSQKSFGGNVDVIKKKLMSLQLVKNTEITKRASQKERRAPFGVLIHGGSSVAKSTFTKMLYYYYGSLHGLDVDDHFRYVRSPTDEYWSNFDSSKWCIQLDDIAFMLPSATSDIDPTIKEMLNVVNNVPYVPPQADVADKGKTPVLARLVLATSNVANLNAKEYFWCPLAVRRRLPYVLKVEPKDELLADNRKFIDPTKLTPIDGNFPDYWRVTVQRVTPYNDGLRDDAILEDVQIYENVNDFLADFGKMSLRHEEIQDKAMTCDVAMKKLTVCKQCCRPSDACKCAQVQASDVEDWVYPAWERCKAIKQSSKEHCKKVAMHTISTILTWVAEFQVVMWSFGLVMKWYYMRCFARRFILPILGEQVQMRIVGYANENMLGTKRWKVALIAFAAVAAAYALYARSAKKANKDVQGNVYGTVESQLEREERANVWYNPTMELSKFDVPLAARSLVGVTPEELEKLISRNIVRLQVRTFVNGEWTTRSNGGIMLKGHKCLTNNHTFRSDASSYEVTCVVSTVSQGLTGNITFTLSGNDLVRRPQNDACVFEVRSLPPFKDITKFWNEQGVELYRQAVILRRQDNGEIERQNVHALNHIANCEVAELGYAMPISFGTCENITVKGDCGAAYVAITPRGPAIFGLHILGRDRTGGAVCLTKELLDEMCSELNAISVVASDVQAGQGPMLEKKGVAVPLTVPHHRSMLRYLEKGNLNVYGSFAGHRAAPKSKVCATPLREIMQERFNYTIGHAAPVMVGWEPWKKNLVEMIKPKVNYRRDVLDMCVTSYTKDVLKGLPSGWEKELMFLSQRASVNGLPGVKFIDRMNVNSSMGFPWNESKKRHLIADVDEMYPEGVTFTDDVWDRVKKIEDLYAEGKRAYPVFMGHLKDEPVTHAKVAMQKTRVFTGAPIDWSLVVRSRLLSFVRLLQKEKFVFEAGPGTVCQSAEWTKVYNYLTTFGTDRIIAGDYGKFDKRMIADFILAAYRIIGNIYKAAGFSEEEVREIACIGEDTAFPLVNFNGDLVEFFGTNPSGHPLTVIVNSLVNSLYMRYCYVILNPDHECDSFKENVRLFTYGDDNIMGVKPGCDWFNHTGIQQELANIGVEYTMADKESESVPFVDIAEVQFLKRSWRFDEDVGAYLCPLEWESIMKSLTTWVPSGTICATEQMVAVISSANSEMFFYGKETFEKHHAFFAEILAVEPYSHYVKEGTLPDWETLVERFHRSG